MAIPEPPAAAEAIRQDEGTGDFAGVEIGDGGSPVTATRAVAPIEVFRMRDLLTSQTNVPLNNGPFNSEPIVF